MTSKGKKAGAVNLAVLEEADLHHFDQDIRSIGLSRDTCKNRT